MKILMIFVDMLRPNLLNMGNNQMKDTPLDRVLKSWKGTFYPNCFTPGPDTPRSAACLWSSRYPIVNGCNTRLRYPQYFLKNSHNNFLHILGSNGYRLNFVMNQANLDLGELPEEFDKAYYYDSGLLEDKLKQVEITEDSFTYISIQDYHAVVNDWDAQCKAAKVGNKLIADELNLIAAYLPLDRFDRVMLYSDHGWAMHNEKMLTPIQQLGRNRTQIMLYIVNKGMPAYRVDKRLCSILDIGPTVCDMAGVRLPYHIDGLSLVGEEKHECILIEDHKNFDVTFGQTIEIWGVRSKKGIACCSTDGIIKANYELSEEVKSKLFEYISEHGSFFRENYFQQSVLDKYHAVESLPYYYDGTVRKGHNSIKSKIKRVVKRLLA